MSSTVATLLFLGFILWLFAGDVRERRTVSSALWIPLTWAFIITSKPISTWLGFAPEGATEDSPVDKALFLLLIGAGLYVLKKRRTDWRAVFRRNKWLFVYFLYQGLSVLWSDESFTAFKRWIKDAGNVVMVLVIVAEADPQEAVKAFFTRYASLVVPLSVLYVKYYPHVSRRYDIWTNKPVFVGMTTDKNTFGMGLFVCALGLFWLLVQRKQAYARPLDKRMLASFALLIVMLIWLLNEAHSATAISCTVFGGLVLLATKVESVRKQVKRLGAYVAALAFLFVLLQASGLWKLALGEFVQVLGRDPTLHGRADIWEAVLKENINPLIGTGFYSFWSPERNQRVSEGWYYQLGTAHNGYIETYLNSGLIGVALLIAMIAAGTRGIKREVIEGAPFGALRLAFLITIVLYCTTESICDRLVPVWLVLLLVMVDYPRSRRRTAVVQSREAPAGRREVEEGSLASRWRGST